MPDFLRVNKSLQKYQEIIDEIWAPLTRIPAWEGYFFSITWNLISDQRLLAFHAIKISKFLTLVFDGIVPESICILTITTTLRKSCESFNQ